MLTFFKDEQPYRSVFEISVTDTGIVISVRLEQSRNALTPNEEISSCNIISVKFEAPSNDEVLIVFACEGTDRRGRGYHGRFAD